MPNGASSEQFQSRTISVSQWIHGRPVMISVKIRSKVGCRLTNGLANIVCEFSGNVT
jgi:hypothetical protein